MTNTPSNQNIQSLVILSRCCSRTSISHASIGTSVPLAQALHLPPTATHHPHAHLIHTPTKPVTTACAYPGNLSLNQKAKTQQHFPPFPQTPSPPPPVIHQKLHGVHVSRLPSPSLPSDVQQIAGATLRHGWHLHQATFHKLCKEQGCGLPIFVYHCPPTAKNACHASNSPSSCLLESPLASPPPLPPSAAHTAVQTKRLTSLRLPCVVLTDALCNPAIWLPSSSPVVLNYAVHWCSAVHASCAAACFFSPCQPSPTRLSARWVPHT